MKSLYLMRHGIAVEPDVPAFADDSLRPLTAVGERKIRRFAKALRRLNLEWDVLLTSPFARAFRTAEIIADVFQNEPPLEVCNDLAPSGDAEAIFLHLRRRHPSAESVLLLGHEPYLSTLASVLLTGQSRLPLTFKKGGLCKLSVPRWRYHPGATLDWLFPPSLLRKR